MIYHHNRQIFITLVLFTVPFYHFLFSRYLDLTERRFSSDVLVPFPDLSDLYSRVMTIIYYGIRSQRILTLVSGPTKTVQNVSHQYERGDSLLRKISNLVLGQQRILSTAFLLAKDNTITIYKKIKTTNKNNE